MIDQSKFIKALNKEINTTPPIWYMRQAGRYLPEYRKIRSRLNLSMGCKANSQHTSGSLHISRKFLNFDLIFLYSGRYLPA